MIQALLAAAVIFFILVVSEFAKWQKLLSNEANRKLVHIATGVFIATWPFFMSFRNIEFMSIALLMVVTVSKQLNLFRGIHGVDRKGWGEVTFALGIGLSAFLTTNKWVFAAAVLHLGLADGLAGLIGESASKKAQYKIFGEIRSLRGTLAFFLTSVAIIIWVLFIVPSSLPSPSATILWLPALAALIENVSIRGMDNVLLPVFVTLVLSHL